MMITGEEPQNSRGQKDIDHMFQGGVSIRIT